MSQKRHYRIKLYLTPFSGPDEHLFESPSSDAGRYMGSASVFADQLSQENLRGWAVMLGAQEGSLYAMTVDEDRDPILPPLMFFVRA